MDFLLRQRAEEAVEQMDLQDADSRRLENTYRQFDVINRTLTGWHQLYVRRVRPFLATVPRPASVLDIGSGGGDLDLMLARWAARDGLEVRITGIDPDPRAIRFALRRPPARGVDFRQAHTSRLVEEGRTYDFVISNHVLHHLSPADLQELLADSELLASRSVLHNDLRRSPAAYALFSVAGLPFAGSYIRGDGLTSIRRSYTVRELRAAAPAGWVVERNAAFHQLLSFRSG